jgi:hypothetical protein
VTDRTVLELHPELIAYAFGLVAEMVLANRAYVASQFINEADRFADVLRIDVTGLPSVRDTLVAAIGDPAPHDWKGSDSDRWHRDWDGMLLNMRLTPTERLPEPGAALEPAPPASDPAGDVVPSPSPVPACRGAMAGYEAECGESGPHGWHPLGDEPPPLAEQPARSRGMQHNASDRHHAAAGTVHTSVSAR